jgi:hypothetical protein
MITDSSPASGGLAGSSIEIEIGGEVRVRLPLATSPELAAAVTKAVIKR